MQVDLARAAGVEHRQRAFQPQAREEAPVVRALEQGGWRVLAGERFRLTSSPAVRITTSILPESEAAELAEVIAGVELAIRPRRLR